MNARTFVLALLGLSIFITGCGPSPVNEKKIASSEAYTKFLQIAKEDYNLEPVTHWVKNTLWIYLPITESLFDLKAKDASPTNDQPSEKYNIQFIDGAYQDRRFVITYDIAKARVYPKDYGYGTSYSQEYQHKQRNLMTAITRAFENAQEKPEFLVIVIADINKGIELKMTVAYQDLDRASKDQTFYEEYAYRAVLTPPQGNTAIIDDKTGTHLDYKPVAWPDFLAKQIVYRIQFKYQQSSFPPTDTPEQTILSAVAQTLKAYNFTDYAGVVLRNLASDETKVVDQAAIAALPTEESKGRLIEIKFR
jgi:hypothetical protein